MPDYDDLLLDLILDSRRRTSSVVRVRSFSSEEEMYATASTSDRTDAMPMQLPRELFDPTTSERKEKLRERIPDAGFAAHAGKLLEQSLPTSIRHAIAGAAPNRPLRLKICSEHRSLLDVPWEWIHDGVGHIALRDHVRITRSVPVRFTTPPVPVQKPVRVLIVVSNPKDEQVLSTPDEIDAISTSLHQPNYDQCLLERPTIEAWREVLESFRPHVIHYIGHGGVSAGEGNVILHDNEVSLWINSSRLSSLVPSTVRLLCLSTCFTQRNYQITGLERVAQASPFCTLPTMIVNRYPVQRQSVQAFWKAFYGRLPEVRGDVNEAFHDARKIAAHAIPTAEWSSYALVLRDNTGRPLEIEDAVRSRALDVQGSDAADLAARAIRAQFRTDVLNQLAGQMKSLGSDAPEDLLHRLNASLETFTKLTGDE